MSGILRRFADFVAIRAILDKLPAADEGARDLARQRQAQLTKPPGSLGRLESTAIWFAGWKPALRAERAAALVFAGNHGVCAQGVAVYPPSVTAQMVGNFERGGAAINQLTRCFGATLSVIALELDSPTNDFTAQPAMTEAECAAAFETGFHAVPGDAEIVILGEMGIGNSTVAAALACALFGGNAADWTGPGTGADAAGVTRKAETIAAGIALHQSALGDPMEVLRRLGGREEAAIAGAVIAARVHRIPVLLDGFICTAAAAPLALVQAGALDHCLAAHCSAEPGHARLLERLDLEPLLRLDMRLGEGSGAAVALPVVRAALACHTGMATFGEAGVEQA